MLEVQKFQSVKTAKLSYAIKLVKETSFQHGWVMSITANGTTTYKVVYENTVTSEDGWKVFEKEIQFPDTTGAESVKLYLQGSPVAAEFIIDDVSLVDLNLIKDGGFEENNESWSKQGIFLSNTSPFPIQAIVFMTKQK